MAVKQPRPDRGAFIGPAIIIRGRDFLIAVRVEACETLWDCLNRTDHGRPIL